MADARLGGKMEDKAWFGVGEDALNRPFVGEISLVKGVPSLGLQNFRFLASLSLTS